MNDPYDLFELVQLVKQLKEHQLRAHDDFRKTMEIFKVQNDEQTRLLRKSVGEPEPSEPKWLEVARTFELRKMKRAIHAPLTKVKFEPEAPRPSSNNSEMGGPPL